MKQKKKKQDEMKQDYRASKQEKKEQEERKQKKETTRKKQQERKQQEREQQERKQRERKHLREDVERSPEGKNEKSSPQKAVDMLERGEGGGTINLITIPRIWPQPHTVKSPKSTRIVFNRTMKECRCIFQL
jgi:ATP-dependent 26S proteasome regulatory subunit